VTSRASLDQVKAWTVAAARAASDKQGEGILILAVGELIGITDAFVLASGSNPRQVRTIVDEVEQKVKEVGGPAPTRVEGLDDARWVLMDFGDFVVHVFLEEVREFYELERLWGDAPSWDWSSSSDGLAVATGR
jgi:ribosome-associated protein